MPAALFVLKKTIRGITGFPLVIPTHQGRAAEKILFSIFGGKGKYIVSNTLFDTTRANIEFSGAEGVDLFYAKKENILLLPAPFKGNMNVEALKTFIHEKGAAEISPVCIITIT